ncbi:AcrB/AcrD/AcrF family protein [Sphingomonas carotinifaciens]|uniref:AcrB/AcrD/AcrF family protein n=1 Tax=Sphingomonas carotinifaciens TaxID=1166323 RepID=UPI0039A015EC
MKEASLGRLEAGFDRHWKLLTLIAWAAVTAWFVYDRWNQIRWMSLGDTDDNMRLMQVRAWLGGQGWYDLRQYRLNPPVGFDIHWSRLVDLPIAGLILFFRLFTSNIWAERLAVGIAPLIPLSVTMLALGATVRRLIAPAAWPLAIAFLLGTAATMLMFMPERIDHHGWQLAMLSVTVAGLCDPQARRGGMMVGLASAASLTIGLEMLPYAAMAGAIIALRWVWDREEAPRLGIYALTLGGGSAAGFVAFASNANYAMRCDALTPVWLSVTMAAGALLFVLARVNPASRGARLSLALVAGGGIAIGFAMLFPQCLTRPEQVSPELQRNWLNNVREAKPIYKHPLRMALPIVVLPLIGLFGAIWATWAARATRVAGSWAAVTLFTAFACMMLLWQARAGPAAQLLAVPGAAALGWLILPWFLNHRLLVVRVGGTVAGFLLVSGLFAGLAIKWFPIDRPKAYAKRVNAATGNCMRTTVLSRLNRYPAQTVFTFVDLGPRLIVTTHHSAIAGPYHRNGDAILDVQHAFQGSEAQARGIMKRHGATLLLLCPNMSESTNYRARAPGGFYDRMASGWVPGWLVPLPIAKGSPLRLYRIE